MFKKNDPYTFATNGSLEDSNSTIIGTFNTEYQITHYDELQLSSGTVSSGVENDGSRQYQLSCTQRIKIYNPNGTNLRPETNTASYENYPALLNTSIQILSSDDISIELIDYTPQTVNSQVQTSGTTGSSTGQTSGSSNSQTVGSSTSQTNSYGVSVGFFGDMLTGSVSAENSTTTSQEQSSTNSSEHSKSNSRESSSSESMSIKDWGSYCLVNPAISSPSWTFGQEYPWDAISCRKTTGIPNPKNSGQVQLIIPSAMAVRLYDGVSLYPPSHLSMFGINFIMKSQWKVTIRNNASEIVKLQHYINYFTASHSLPDNSKIAAVYLDDSPAVLSTNAPCSLINSLDLGILGLAPLNSQNSPAIVGFLPSKFIVKPVPFGEKNTPVPFRIFSSANTLRITDSSEYGSIATPNSGFTVSETALTANLQEGCSKLKITLLFKVTDAITNYTFYMKHWKDSSSGVSLQIVINGDVENSLVKYVDALESEGGENNLLSIALRNLDITSTDYHDYLTLGLNSIDITITPINPSTSSIYQIRAVSVEAV